MPHADRFRARRRVAPALLLVPCVLLAAAGGCSPPTARVAGVRLENIDLQTFTVVFDVELTNPNAAALPLAGFDYELASDGVSFFAGQGELDGGLPARGSRTLTLPATVTYSQLMLVLSQAKLGSVLPYEAELGVSIRVPIIQKFRIPLRHKGKLPLPAPPGVELVGLAWHKLTLDHAGGTLRLRLTNPNQFDVKLDSLSLSLALGGMDVGGWRAARPVDLARDGGSGELELPVSFSPKKLGLAALGMLAGSSTYEIKGEIGVDTEFGRIRMPITKAGRISPDR